MPHHTPIAVVESVDPLSSWREVAASGNLPLLLIRHGRTASNARRRLAGRLDDPLDDEGIVQARALAERLSALPRAALYASPLLRARQTAEAIGAPYLDADLQEMDHGDLEGMAGADVAARYPEVLAAWGRDPSDALIPGGETLRQCRDRTLAALGRIVSAHRPGPPIVVVGHKLSLGSVLLTARGEPLKGIHSLDWANTGIYLLSWAR